jgi:hypothetical protein
VAGSEGSGQGLFGSVGAITAPGGDPTAILKVSFVTLVGANRGAGRSTRRYAALKLAIFDHKDTVYKYVLDSLRVFSRSFVCSLIDDSLRVEHGDISIGANSNASLVPHRRSKSFKPSSRHNSHLAQRIRYRESFLLSCQPSSWIAAIAVCVAV